MSDRRKPKKPVRNPAHIVLSKGRPARRVVEELPREQEALEFTVGRKFLGAFQRFEGVQFHDLQRGSEPADLMCKSSSGHTVGLQIVEVIHCNYVLIMGQKISQAKWFYGLKDTEFTYIISSQENQHRMRTLSDLTERIEKKY